VTILESYDIDQPLFEFISKHANAKDEALFHTAIVEPFTKATPAKGMVEKYRRMMLGIKPIPNRHTDDTVGNQHATE
jgi:hypothetical protein